MKKIILLIVAFLVLFGAGIAFAQQNSTALPKEVAEELAKDLTELHKLVMELNKAQKFPVQVKIFINASCASLQDEFNDWSSKNIDEIEIIKIFYRSEGHYIITVFYRQK